MQSADVSVRRHVDRSGIVGFDLSFRPPFRLNTAGPFEIYLNCSGFGNPG